MNISTLKGQTIKSTDLAIGSGSCTFITKTGDSYRMYHEQDCCESVCIEDIDGDIEDILNSPILLAESVSNSDLFNGKPENQESFTWTFYKLATVKGYLTIRWLGESNGYYSERVDFMQDSISVNGNVRDVTELTDEIVIADDGKQYTCIDGFACQIISSRYIGDIKILEADLCGDSETAMFIASLNGFNSHGTSIREAVNDLNYKIGVEKLPSTFHTLKNTHQLSHDSNP